MNLEKFQAKFRPWVYAWSVEQLFPEPTPGAGASLVEQRLKRLESMVIGYSRENDLLREQNRLLMARLFGRKSERYDDTLGNVQQLSLLTPPETAPKSNESPGSKSIKVAGHSRVKKGRKPLPDGLPRVDRIYDLAENEKLCGCGEMKTRIGQEVSEKLDIIPARIQVLRQIRPKYACRHCEGVHDLPGRSTVAVAPVPEQILPKAIASSALLAHIVISKFADALPLYRQEVQFQRLGAEIRRGTMCSWIIRLSEACAPLMAVLRESVLDGRVINCDETTLQVLDEPGKAATDLSYLWIFVGGTAAKPAIEFIYSPTRSSSVAAEYLKTFRGFVQTDAYSGYEFLATLEHIVHILCWAHVRRNFFDVVKAAGAAHAVGGVAAQALERIKLLYAVEASARERGLSPAQLHELRQTEALPILKRFHPWLEDRKNETPPRSLLGKAVRYALNQWSGLERYLEDGELAIDNNRAENAIRPVAVGRKNWLFTQTPEGAHASATFYSLIETAKANRIEPHRYLRHLFDQLPFAKTTADFRALLPQYIDRSALVPP